MSMEEVDPARVGAFGLSQGGALTVACAALEPCVRWPFLCICFFELPGAKSGQSVVGYRVIRYDLFTFKTVCRIQQSTSAQRAYGLL